MAIGVANGWIESEWLIVIAIALSLSLAISAILSGNAHRLYSRHRNFWKHLERDQRLFDEQPFDMHAATTAVVEMGRMGTGAYDEMYNLVGKGVVGVDFDPIKVHKLRSTGRSVLLGDPIDADFWDRIAELHTIELVMLALPNLSTTLSVLKQLESAQFSGRVSATARYPDEVEALKDAGAATVFIIYTEAGTGFATHVASESAD